MVSVCEHITYFATSFDVHYAWDTEIRVDFNSYMYLMDILDPATDFNAKRLLRLRKMQEKGW